jgi:hypothetical protein
MLDKIKKLLLKKPLTQPEVKKTTQSKPKPAKKELSEKELATLNNEPYIAITKIEINPDNINDGAFELDYNDKFVLNLIRAGYKFREDDTDQIIVDRWLQNTCRNIALEMYEQQVADPLNRDTTIRPIQTRNLGNGRTEVS